MKSVKLCIPPDVFIISATLSILRIESPHELPLGRFVFSLDYTAADQITWMHMQKLPADARIGHKDGSQSHLAF